MQFETQEEHIFYIGKIKEIITFLKNLEKTGFLGFSPYATSAIEDLEKIIWVLENQLGID